MGGVVFLIVFIISLVAFTLGEAGFWTGVFFSFIFAITAPLTVGGVIILFSKRR